MFCVNAESDVQENEKRKKERRQNFTKPREKKPAPPPYAKRYTPRDRFKKKQQNNREKKKTLRINNEPQYIRVYVYREREKYNSLFCIRTAIARIHRKKNQGTLRVLIHREDRIGKKEVEKHPK